MRNIENVLNYHEEITIAGTLTMGSQDELAKTKNDRQIKYTSE